MLHSSIAGMSKHSQNLHVNPQDILRKTVSSVPHIRVRRNRAREIQEKEGETEPARAGKARR